MRPDSGIGSTKAPNREQNQPNAGLFWSNSKTLSTTSTTKVTDNHTQWSLESGMDSKSFDLGFSFPIGKVDVGAKFGFSREKSYSKSSSFKSTEMCFTAVHVVPAVQINLNETTVLLSPYAENDIKKLRKDRNFDDLMLFFDKYGIVPKGSLWHWLTTL